MCGVVILLIIGDEGKMITFVAIAVCISDQKQKKTAKIDWTTTNKQSTLLLKFPVVECLLKG